jgi:predicted Zn-dependent peptidase
MQTELRAIKKETLPNGLTIITEEMPVVRSVAVGIWVKSGSRVEPAPLNGMSHFIEHMVFKGTERRSVEQIARESDALGGHLDAFTTKELVCFNAKVLDEHVPRALDILADLVLAPLFQEDDIRRERNVILEEIKMDEDNPDYLVHEMFAQMFWRGHAMGRPVLGTQETLADFRQPVVRDFFRTWYVPNQMLITAAGHLDHGRFVDQVASYFQQIPARGNGYRDVTPTSVADIARRNKRELKQVHLCVGAPCYPLAHEQRYAVALLNTILGGGMSSRLFQKIREREGLAYAIFSDVQAYRDTGCLVVYAGTAMETAQRTLRLMLEEFRYLKQEPVPAEELRRAQDNLKASLVFSLETTTARMSNLARQEIYFGRFFTFDEVLAEIDAVTPDQIQTVARDCLQPERLGVSAVGQLDDLQLSRDELDC